MLFKNRNRRSLPAQWGRRMSAITGSLTTTASGMPIVESQPMRQRSSSLKGTSLNFHQNFTLNRLFVQHQSNVKLNEQIQKNQEEQKNEHYQFINFNESSFKSKTVVTNNDFIL